MSNINRLLKIDEMLSLGVNFKEDYDDDDNDGQFTPRCEEK